MEEKLKDLSTLLVGELYHDHALRTLYATDASAYREMPLAVVIPKGTGDLKQLIEFAGREGVALIPRTAGTSLAGQVVGSGIVVDVSKNFTKILEINPEEKWVRVQPGVIRDELNMFLASYGLFFGPETSTSNRCMVGGMVGNNSCGARSVIYGSTRDHLLSVKVLLSDGSETEFKAISNEEFEAKCRGIGTSGELETTIYQQIQKMLGADSHQQEIRREYPKKSIKRRNTGYAIDLLLETAPFTEGAEDFNFCKLIAGSEGTLAFITEIKLNLVPAPPKQQGLVCIHFNSINDALKGNLIALKYDPSACELMDNYILECTKESLQYRQNRFFVEGDPEAILVVELLRHSREEVDAAAQELIEDLKKEGLGYHFPIIYGKDIKKVWDLRKAGLGLLSNIPGDAKPAPVIEDTAVDVEDLPEFISEFNETLKQYNLYCVHYAHAGSGELHLRPILNLKTKEGNQLFHKIADEIAQLVKKYKGSLSGEHGDGRLRGEFIPFMIGENNYGLLEELKDCWDPMNIFNPGKIVRTPKMNEQLRYEPEMVTPDIETTFNFDRWQGVLRTAELCNGSGDCRKTHLSGGTMCPSYMATKDEKDTTRARANILRETLTQSEKLNRFDSEEVYQVMDLCLSCKGCKAECPSNVDMAKLKGEFLQQYYDANGVPFRARLIAETPKANALAAKMPGLYNFVFKNKVTANWAKKTMGFAAKRSIPLLEDTTLKKWWQKHQRNNFGLKLGEQPKGKVMLFCDEFTNYNDVSIGIRAIKLLTQLGYEVIIPEHRESARTYLSKGLVREAKKIVNENIRLLSEQVNEDVPLLGVEPSAILSFRDEYLDLAEKELMESAQKLSENALLIDEFIAREIDKGIIKAAQFSSEKRLIKVHGHCHQKALSSLVPTKKMLSLPQNYEVHMIPSGCCGMAGSFGYEEEHYEVSMQIGELVLFPTVRKQPDEVIIAAPGTSCRHQIKDGTGRQAKHPVEILYEALI
ncbi:FAD-binding and (Fe-S)-binding domain-containing protein [Xanthovirga aplysinae]|uniref:FAD-binding and (Fe-S)-binding domain-containing protein n=1 Tax=Xanthovirga aplysinae TaxID=2529853 RepID=UPI0012BB5E62|nr:FAD-binding and (Fe-S)-binding domain-containing protein [Xanthovirga aplysinae]MTI32427.1 FAD-binding oxidoreductase [Xanthovirga aplysinae]